MLTEIQNLYSRITMTSSVYGEIDSLAARLAKLPTADVVQAAQGFGLRLPRSCTRAVAVREIVRKLTELQQSSIRISAI